MELLGDLTVACNILLLFLLVIAITIYFKRDLFDFQFLILIAAIFLLLPVIIFENVLYIDITYNWYSLPYNTWFMRFLFALGIISYFVYNLHLLTIEDMPSFPTTITAIIIGFAIGSMGVSANVDPSASSPIYYEPIIGGTFFIFSLMTFNIIGVSGFFFSYLWKPYGEEIEGLSLLDLLGIGCFFLSPIVIYIARITSLVPIPVNGIFLITEISFSLHLFSFIRANIDFGYPLHPDLVSMSIIDMTENTVIAGFSTQEDVDFNKLQGMTILAVDSIIKDVFETTDRQTKRKYSLNYGDTILLRNENYLMVSLFRGKGKKVGRIVLTRLLENFVNAKSRNECDFEYLTKKYLQTFFKKKKFFINSENIYY